MVKIPVKYKGEVVGYTTDGGKTIVFNDPETAENIMRRDIVGVSSRSQTELESAEETNLEFSQALEKIKKDQRISHEEAEKLIEPIMRMAEYYQSRCYHAEILLFESRKLISNFKIWSIDKQYTKHLNLVSKHDDAGIFWKPEGKTAVQEMMNLHTETENLLKG
jgi:hypothetical protein